MPASIGVNLRVTGHCAQGGRRYMEDLFSVAYQQTEDERDLEYAFFGIYDGHGGGEAAAYAKEHLMDSIVKQRAFWSARDEDVLRAIRNGYMLTHLNMWKELDKWPKTVTGLPSTAGTTASVAFIRRGKIYIGHVGDSAIVLGYQKEGSDQWVAKPLTLDHKPESTAEMERIQQSGGKVVSKAGVPRVVWNRPRAGHKGPIKKTTPVDEIPFLAVARSLGDLWSYNVHNDEFIVSPDPDVGVLNIDTDKFRCLIFGTDGLWNMISAETAVNLVQATERHNEAAVVAGGQDWLNPSKSLVDNALERWSNTRMRADNTSVVTLMLDPPGPPRAAVLRSRNTPQRPLAANTQAAPSVTPQDKCEETTKPEVPSTEDAHPVPQKGLKIMTRYTEEQPPATPELSPLPPCATLDSRFSVAPTDEICNGHEEEIDEAATTYGNPSDSYFISRLLNRTHVTNTLLNFFEDNIAKDEEKAREQTPPPQSTVPDAEGPTAVTNEDAPVEGLSVDSSFESEEEPEASTEDEQAVEPPDDVESIQINEVSSSSPTDSPPKPRGRKTRAESQLRQPATNGRTLRSHDAGTPQRPQTRLTSNRGRSNQGQSTSLERVVILSRARGVPISPAVVQVERMPQLATESRPLTRKHNEPKTVAPPPDSRVKVMRSTRSRDVNPMNLTQKLVRNQSNPGHKEIRSVVTRGSENVVQLNRAGNAVRAPGSSRRNAPAAVRDRSETPDARPEHSKENFTMKRYKVCVLRSRHVHAAPLPPSERRRTRLCDKRDPLGALDVSAIAQPSLPLGAVTRRSPVRRMRRCRTEEVCAEVHSTTGENEPQRMECSPSASTALTVKPRALRSRNDESTSATVVRRDVATKRPPRAIDDEHSPPGKTPKMMEKPLCAEKCTRVASKRSSGSWAPALALRNRLRKRLAK